MAREGGEGKSGFKPLPTPAHFSKNRQEVESKFLKLNSLNMTQGSSFLCQFAICFLIGRRKYNLQMKNEDI